MIGIRRWKTYKDMYNKIASWCILMRVCIIYFVIHELLVMQEVHNHYITSPSMSPKWIETNTSCYVKGSLTFFGSIFFCTLKKAFLSMSTLMMHLVALLLIRLEKKQVGCIDECIYLEHVVKRFPKNVQTFQFIIFVNKHI